MFDVEGYNITPPCQHSIKNQIRVASVETQTIRRFLL